MHADCERARQWASAELDGELSEFERVLLEGHVGFCASCAEFRARTAGMTALVRSAPPEPFEAGFELRRVRRHIRLRLAPAVAVLAVSLVGLGSILSASLLRSESALEQTTRSPGLVTRGPSLATGPASMMLLRIARDRHLPAVPVVNTRAPKRPVRGGVVLK